MLRVAVLSPSGEPLMPTKASRARRWVRDGKARIVTNDLNLFAVQLIETPSGTQTQPMAVGVDPGKHFSGVGVQSNRVTLWRGHLDLPYPKIRQRMETRRIMRRTRRSRRINRKIPYSVRAHRQKRFDNRRGNKLPPSIRANRQLELRIVTELSQLFPVTNIVYEVVKAKGSKSFSPVMVGQKWQLDRLAKIAPVTEKMGWETSKKRKALGLEKDKTDKSRQVPETHANDGIALAATCFEGRTIRYGDNVKYVTPYNATITPSPFAVISRPPVSRRQLHLLQCSKGGKRRKYGGTVTRHGHRKGDFVEGIKAGKTYRGWVSGNTKTQVSVSDANWKRIGQFAARNVRLLKCSSGLIVKSS